MEYLDVYRISCMTPLIKDVNYVRQPCVHSLEGLIRGMFQQFLICTQQGMMSERM